MTNTATKVRIDTKKLIMAKLVEGSIASDIEPKVGAPNGRLFGGAFSSHEMRFLGYRYRGNGHDPLKFAQDWS